jgi:hypothetical protein
VFPFVTKTEHFKSFCSIEICFQCASPRQT